MTGTSGSLKAKVLLGSGTFHVLQPASRPFSSDVSYTKFLGSTKLKDAFVPVIKFWGLLKL